LHKLIACPVLLFNDLNHLSGWVGVNFSVGQFYLFPEEFRILDTQWNMKLQGNKNTGSTTLAPILSWSLNAKFNL